MTPLISSLSLRALWFRYGAATLLILGFALLRAALSRHLHDYSFFLFTPAVFLAALLFGRGPARWATLLSGVMAVGLFTDPWYRVIVTEDDTIPLVLFLATCLGVGDLTHALRQALVRAKEAEEQLELLLRELEHRMKNNFQIISSVLSAQARMQTHPQTREALETAAARVNAIARAQDGLRLDSGSSAIPLDEYLRDLCTGLGELLGDGGRIKIMVDAERMDVPRAVATSTGLIVNELVTNAFKYAFPDGRAGTVRVSLATTPDEVELCVCDDGVGYMPGERKGLGARLTAHLARQVGGSIHREDEQPGCRVVAQFPRPPLSSADSSS